MSDANRSEDLQRVVDNLAKVNSTIAAAAQRSGRRPSDVRLVAVSKYLTVAQTGLLIDAGCRDLGENRPQQLWQKAEATSPGAVRWHLIGHLQRNKLKRTLPLVDLVHSIDSLALWQAVDRWAIESQTLVQGLIEVNVSGDANKHGFSPIELFKVFSQLGTADASVGDEHNRDEQDDMPHDRATPHATARASMATTSAAGRLQIHGLMGMASLEGGAAQAQQDFAALRELRDRLAAEFPQHATWTELSMGMSGDYEQAIAEGSTLVRVGSALIEGISRA